MSEPVSANESASPRKTFPPWLKIKWPARYDDRTRRLLDGLRLNTVCQSAECPNLGECWNRGAATFMILGECCTRACHFCAVKTGRGESMESLADEPARVAQAAQQLKLRHVVVTSVNRDDLDDEGAGHFARVICSLREACGADLIIEVLTPDFHAREDCLRTVLEAGPDLFNHNLETIRRLHPVVRPQAKYDRSLEVIRRIRQLDSQRTTKSGLMVGMGETQEEMREALRDLRAAGCEILTVGQYLSPSKEHYPVAEYVAPDVFTAYREYAMELGFRAAFCGPFVRSSYQAEQVFEHSRWKRC